MFPWLWIWSPHLNFPWSGSVAQRIEPDVNWFFDSINAEAGNGSIEQKAFDVASYGRQLGLLAEVLIEVADRQSPLSAEAATSLARLKEIQDRIEQIKEADACAAARDIEERVLGMRQRSPAEFARLCARLRPVLDAGSA